MYKVYFALHILIFTMYACSMGSQRKRLYSPRDIDKTFWVWCKPELLNQVKDLKIPIDSRDHACLRRCKPGERNKIGKCKEYEVLYRPLSHEKFYHGKWIIMPE